MCVLFNLQLLSEIFLIPRKIQQRITINVHKSSCIIPFFLSGFNETLIFSKDIQKIFKYQNSLKSVQWESSCSMRAGRWTET